MSPTTRVVRNRIYIDDRHYDAKVQGGGKFNVVNAAGVLVGSFQVRGRAVEAEDLGIEGADPVEQIGRLWVKENLSAVPEPRPAGPAPIPIAPPLSTAAPQAPVAAPPIAPPPEPAPVAPAPAGPAPSPSADATSRPICRVATHNPPDAAALRKALAYQEWLRHQPGVASSCLMREPKTGKLVSVTVWADRDKFNAMRYAKPPTDASPLVSVTVEIGEVLA